eukprot:CAMPEP_0175123520 /NCGR_PEP_ID=MMETSP0087-20121206/2290_1 /TAXON_ID=136419 /ORGANISM="Unknown Unknown, Strain D1" /LENGTH=101 /DNA_ID=CAMNT_0016405223 /DNA_START=209 /DNA_END=511 /DNA_ORIENTATION=+
MSYQAYTVLFLRNPERVAFGASSFPVATKGESSDSSEVRSDELWDDTLGELSDTDNSPSFKDVIIRSVSEDPETEESDSSSKAGLCAVFRLFELLLVALLR